MTKMIWYDFNLIEYKITHTHLLEAIIYELLGAAVNTFLLFLQYEHANRRLLGPEYLRKTLGDC